MSKLLSKRLPKVIALALALCMLLQLGATAVFAEENSFKEPLYKKFLILGDSLCLGFSTEAASMADVDTYDIEGNAVNAGNLFPHNYPTQLGRMLGLDVTYDPDNGDDSIDVYNYGICAAWSGDILQLLTDPFYVYEYYIRPNYTDEDYFVLPTDATATRVVALNDPANYAKISADSEAYPGVKEYIDSLGVTYDIADPLTWVGPYVTVENAGDPELDYNDKATWVLGEEGAYNFMKPFITCLEDGFDWSTWETMPVPVYEMEEYTVSAGTEVRTAYYIGSDLVMNPIITKNFYYLSKNCVKDGEVDWDNVIYYPTEFVDYGGGIFTWQPKEDEDTIAEYGEWFISPKFAKYYYDTVVGRIEEGDLIALAAGGNDIYHSMMPYQQKSGTVSGDIIYWLTYALQMNWSVGDMLEAIAVPGFLEGLFGFDTEEEAEETKEMLLTFTQSLQANEEGIIIPEDTGDDPFEQAIAIFNGILAAIDDITTLLDYYSQESITAYFEENHIIENYKKNTEATIQRIQEINPDAEIVLVGHFNPYGMQNYLTMLAEYLKNGKLFADIWQDLGAIGTLIKLLIGEAEDYTRFAELSPEEQVRVQNETREAVRATVNELTKKAADMDAEQLDAMLTKLVVDTSFPMAVLMIGDGLSGVYAQYNEFVQEMAEKYGLAYADMSNAPTSGRFDPHPTAVGHTWIAKQLYKTVVPTVTATICPCGTGFGTLTPLGTTEYRLHAEDATYKFTAVPGSTVSAVYVDGEYLDPNDYPDVYLNGEYTFAPEQMLKSHTLAVQFDFEYEKFVKHLVTVKDSYAPYSGVGWYFYGDTVTVNAGEREGYQFAGWEVEGVEELSDPLSPTVTFTMPANHVKLTALWIDNYTLYFNTNYGSDIAPVSQRVGTTLSLNAYKPTRANFEFAGWYADSKLTKKIDSYTFDANGTVYAKWIGQLSFDTNGGGVILPVTLADNEIYSLDGVVPFKADNSTFEGWYLDKDLKYKVTEYVFHGNATLYAKWTTNSYVPEEQPDTPTPVTPDTPVTPTTATITFNTNGGMPVSPLTVNIGATVSLNNYTTTKEGFKFLGWYTDSATQKLVDEVTVTANMTVYAKWAEDGEVPHTGTQDNPTIWVLLMVVASASVLGIAAIFRRRGYSR